MVRPFNCDTKHMLASMPGWRYPGGDRRLIVSTFFHDVVAIRPNHVFLVVGEDKGYSAWQPGDDIDFYVRGHKSASVRATLRRCVAQPHECGFGHFELDNIRRI